MTRYYKATRPDGRDFFSGTIDYAAALVSGDVIRHPDQRVKDDPSTYLSVSVEPADCTGFSWPCRLFRVEPVGRAIEASDLPNKRAVSALRVVEELPAHMALGPNGEAVAALLERVRAMTPKQIRRLDAAWDAARDAARVAAWVAAWNAARVAARVAAGVAAGDAAWNAAWNAAGDAALGLVVRDLISTEHFDRLTQPFVDAGLGEWADR